MVDQHSSKKEGEWLCCFLIFISTFSVKIRIFMLFFSEGKLAYSKTSQRKLKRFNREAVIMVCFVNVILVAAMICNFVTDATAQGAQVQNNDNSEQFALLCRIYNVAKNPPINHVDLQDPLKIVKEIDALNSSLAEEKLFNETEQVGNSSDAYVKLTTTREAAVAQAILSRITQKAHTILKEIIKVNATRDIERAKANFTQVIFGEGMNESHLCDGVLNEISDRAAACGNKGLSSRGASAGKNLVVDFFCLCAQRPDGNGIDNVCGVQVGGKSKGNYHGWSDTAPLGSPSMWASIKKECGKLLHKHPKSTQEGYELLEDFLTHLKSGGLYRWGAADNNGVDGSDRKPGMLGTAAETKESNQEKGLVCDGSRGNKSPQHARARRKSGTLLPGGVCVYYGSQSEWQSIPWLMKLTTALATVEHVNNKTASIQRGIEKLHTLLQHAEEIYETTNVISKIQTPVVPTNLQKAAKRLTAFNAAWSQQYHFILPWVLLLL
ncbi:Variant surface glycoprotein [Trypanosoma congolense IL3000]|uniref:Variant surface glycoprotein n=1 Tax=Trypanosoma congolense (strain IL3000) TaxID=1068625 RepID=F9WI46_TRYCI|nr:Variant surface glycoprotein [Trypanosoma congolense IL3000]